MTKKAMKKIIDDQPESFFVLYKSVDVHGQPVNSLLFEEQKNLCRETLIKIYKEAPQ